MHELGIHRAGDLSDEALAAARTAANGDLELMARHLGVSLRGLQRRLGAPSDSPSRRTRSLRYSLAARTK
jgi:hypothetical protein